MQRHSTVLAITKAMYALGLDLLRAFACALEIEDEDWFVKRHRYEVPSRDSFRWIKYQPVPESVKPGREGVIRTGAHSDYGLFFPFLHGQN
jgi:isopenicillin N synthase-like dioxygenase